jgi:hypothetical protein
MYGKTQRPKIELFSAQSAIKEAKFSNDPRNPKIAWIVLILSWVFEGRSEVFKTVHAFKETPKFSK